MINVLGPSADFFISGIIQVVRRVLQHYKSAEGKDSHPDFNNLAAF